MRRIEGVEDYESPTAWLAGVDLTPTERMQLVWLIQLMDPELDEAAIMNGAFRDFENANGIAEVPIEWWDVEDDDGRVRYQLWISCVDGAQLLDAGTTSIVATASAFAFYGDGWEGTKPGSLADELHRAQAVVKGAGIPTELAAFAFVAHV